MVLDAAKGIEPQTLKLFEVCRDRQLPIITFVNKWDRAGARWARAARPDRREALTRHHAHRLARRHRRRLPRPHRPTVGRVRSVPGGHRAGRRSPPRRSWRATWRPGRRATPTRPRPTRSSSSTRSTVSSTKSCFGPASSARCSSVRRSRTSVSGSCSTQSSTMCRRRRRAWTRPGRRAPSTPPSAASCSRSRRTWTGHTATASPSSGCARDASSAAWWSPTGGPGNPSPPSTPTAFSVKSAETIEVAYPGDAIGLVNANDVVVGDTLWADTPVAYPPIPKFAPEHFAVARVTDTARFKQFRRGVEQLDQEGVIQVLRDPDLGDQAPVLRGGRPDAVRGRQAPSRQRVRRPGGAEPDRLPGRTAEPTKRAPTPCGP